jgi:hypothetical protein
MDAPHQSEPTFVYVIEGSDITCDDPWWVEEAYRSEVFANDRARVYNDRAKTDDLVFKVVKVRLY